MKAAFYEKDITPPLGCYLAGSYVNHVATDVLDPLFVRAAVIENNGTTVAMIDIDSCEFPEDMHDIVTERIRTYTGIDSSHVMITVNHTHKGIPIFDNPELLAYADVPYKDVAYRLIADCVILANMRLQESDLLFGESKAEGIAFNRTFIMKDGTYRTNCHRDAENIVSNLAGVDESVPVLFACDKEGHPKGAIVSFACHQDVNPGTAYSGGFASILSKDLKKKFGEDFVTVFFAGTSGDINHLDPARLGKMPKDTYVHMGHVLSEAILDAYDHAAPIMGDCVISLKEKLKVPKRPYDRQSVLADIRKFAEEGRLMEIRNLAVYEACNQEMEQEVYLQCIRIGDVAFFGYSGEVFVNFGLALKERCPFQKVIIATLANCGCGYVVTREALAPQSRMYETALCLGTYLDQEAGYLMNDKLFELSERAAEL